MAVEITINQPSGAGAGVVGKARNDIWLDKVVELVSSGAGSSWLWELLDRPFGSSAVITNETAQICSIDPDVIGTYRVKLTTEAGFVIKVFRVRFSGSGVLTKRGWALPAVEEEKGEADYGFNTRHWAEVWDTLIDDLLDVLDQLAGRWERHYLAHGTFYNDTATPGTVGATYLNYMEMNTYPVPKVVYRVVMATTSATAGYEAYMDLYDVNGILNGGTPGVVSGSQMDTTTGSPPLGGPTPNALVLSAYEVDVTAAFFGGGWPGFGVFEARLWLGTEGGGNAATCASAELIFS